MLEGRVLKLGGIEYRQGEWDGANRSGWRPLDDKVLVLIDEAPEKTSGGITLVEDIQERQTAAAEHGIIVALGEAAFVLSDDSMRAWSGERPKPGDRCYIARYAGQLIKGRDGQMYRLLSQKCVAAIADE